MQDKNLMLRAASAGDLTDSETGSAIDFGAGGAREATTIKVVVPQASGTNPTADVVIEESDVSGFNTVEDKHTLPQIVAAGVYRISFRRRHRYVRHKSTTGGTGRNFGAVAIGPEMQGEYTEF